MTGVTVGIPTYNRSDLLARAIGSVFAQQVTPDVVIIVDDGSTDDTSAVVAASDNGPVPLRYLHQDNAGGAAARNLGVEAATTEWVAFLDSDDEWESDHLARLLQAVEEGGHPGDPSDWCAHALRSYRRPCSPALFGSYGTKLAASLGSPDPSYLACSG